MEVCGKRYRGSITSNTATAVTIPRGSGVDPQDPSIATPIPASSIIKQDRQKNLSPPRLLQLSNSTNTSATTQVKAKAKGGPRPSQTGKNRNEPKNERRDVGADGSPTSIDPLRQEPPSKPPGGPNNTPESQSGRGVKQQPSQRRRKQRGGPPQNTSANITPSGVPGYLLASENGNKRNTQQPGVRVNGNSSIDPSSLRGQSLKSSKTSTELDGFRGGVPRELVKQQPQPQLLQPLANTSNRPPPPWLTRCCNQGCDSCTSASTCATSSRPLQAYPHSESLKEWRKANRWCWSYSWRCSGITIEHRTSVIPIHARSRLSRLRPEAPVFIPAAAIPRPPPPLSTLSPQPSPQRQQTRQPKSPQKMKPPSEPPLSTPPPLRRRSSQPSSWNTVGKSRLSPPCSTYSPFTDWRYMTNDTVLAPTTWGADPYTREGYLSPGGKASKSVSRRS
ncbi:hypothetical protein CCMSSC00406_0006882 [Pleurotus cornucopiae]|uniref:Uncharacterized protein n=1 Tax=Pleurotus cornucopiae TaxID=5321 RepID=A0ACB7IR29_PLECO|nr:hypothetical protein CCMSSC00406_0006882 [Pleurotus cornucopiae]